MGGQGRPPLRVQCKSPGECVTRCHSHRSRFTPVLAWQLASLGELSPYRRRVVRYGKVTFVWWPQRSILVLAVMLRQGAPRVLAPLFAYFFWQDRKSRSAKQQLRYYRILPHTDNPSVKTCGFATSPCTGEALGGQGRPPLRGESGVGCKTKILRLRYPDSRRILRFPR